MLILVVAKSPVAGRVKTRLCPPHTHTEAAELAEAALADTLDAAAACGASERVLALDGAPGPWLPSGFRVIPQRGDGLASRLAAAWSEAGGPGLQIGMDTPQVTRELLDQGLAALSEPRVDAVLGLAEDGGWWALGQRHPNPGVFPGVEMSSPRTGALQAARLAQLGLRTTALPTLRDVDTFDDVAAVAALAPQTRFAAVAGRLAVGASV